MKNILNEIKKYQKSIKIKRNNYKWIFEIIIITVLLTLFFSFLAEILVSKVNIILGILIVVIFILFGIIFDMIGVAVTTASLAPFHSMNSRKIKGAKNAINLIQNQEKVASFCNDVVGDICGIVSGSVGILISSVISINYNYNLFYTNLIVTSVIAGFTIGGKALGKSIAMNENVMIVYRASKVINIFKK